MKVNSGVLGLISDVPQLDVEMALVYIFAMCNDLSSFKDVIDEEHQQAVTTLLLHKNYITEEWQIKRPIFSEDFEPTAPKRAKARKSKTIKQLLVEKEFEEKVVEYREVFKATGKPGATGALSIVKKKMKKFFKDNPQYTWDDVINTAKYYVESLGDNYTYLQQADYFISKGNESSRLEALIEEGKDHDNNTNGFKTLL